MSTYKVGLGSIQAAISRGGGRFSNPKASIGKVYGVITTPNTPSPEIYNKYGGETAIGTIFIKDYSETTKNDNTIDYSDDSSYKVAKPLFPWIQDYPVIGELVLLANSAPSIDTQARNGDNTSLSLYYISPLNLWNNSQENAPSGNTLGKTFTENPEIRKIWAFEGDRIIQGRKGNGIRFGSTVSSLSDLNEWSTIGNNGDPITTVINGYVTDANSQTPIVEEINKEKSSIYITSTQKIPLQPGASIINPRVNTVKPNNYIFSQLIFNSDRITLNSKKDEVLLFAKTNIGLNTNNNITLNTKGVIHLNTNSQILLGTTPSNTAPIEPVLLGDQTVILLEQIIVALRSLGGYLSSAVSTKPGDPIPGINSAGRQLLNSLEDTCDQLEKIKSKKVFTV
jgi:hypothetical protein